MDPVTLAADERPRPGVVLPAFEGPLDLLLHLVRQDQVSIWDIPIAKVCDQYHHVLREMESLDLEIAGEYLVYAAWLMVIKSRMLLPRREDAGEEDPRKELVDRLLEYEKVRFAAVSLAGLEEVRRGMEGVRTGIGKDAEREEEVELEEVDVVMLALALYRVIERHQREHPPTIDLAPMRFSVREKIVELFDMLQRDKSLAFLSHMLTRADREETVTLLIAALELVRLRAALLHQRQAFGEIFLTATGNSLPVEALGDV
jgi:segregation and condensation protein A